LAEDGHRGGENIRQEKAVKTVSYDSYFFTPEVEPLFPTSLAIPHGRAERVVEGDTAFGFVFAGTARTEGFVHQELHEGMFFSTPGPATLIDLKGFACIRRAYHGLPMCGGPIEVLGRLKYIDGCSDTLLLAPPVKGDPCLNYLYIPRGIRQTPHTHPSVRVGCVIDGAGVCVLANNTADLIPGVIFILPAGELHSFHTPMQPLRVVVYHPDSDFGPTDNAHPMINRTIIDNVTGTGGKSACP
jgi:quercetin dioxygenase-like cupin family protein